jgi:hypothetical protein
MFTCRRCNQQTLVRDTSRRAPFYHCTNLSCPSRQKKPRSMRIGNVTVYAKPEGK